MNGFKTNSLGEIEECSEKPSIQDNGNIYTATSNEFLTGKLIIYFICVSYCDDCDAPNLMICERFTASILSCFMGISSN